MADTLHYVIVLTLVVMAAITAWSVLTPNHLFIG